MTLRESASGKIILLGEHAVVYGFPALAVPLSNVRAYAELLPRPAGFAVEAEAIGLSAEWDRLADDHPLARGVRLTVEQLGIPLPSALLRIVSDIPVASGLGSGAAVATAVVRVLAAAAGKNLPPAEVSRIVYEVERIHHGTPSGIDNTVIAYEQPVFFRRGEPPQPVRPGGAFSILVADSGIRSETKTAVNGVRERRAQDPGKYDSLFGEMGALAEKGRRALQTGNVRALGQAMEHCHPLLQAIGVSLPVLDRLVLAAHSAGAAGAKLSGAGLGGNVAVLAQPDADRDTLRKALREAGSVRIFETVLSETRPGCRSLASRGS